MVESPPIARAVARIPSGLFVLTAGDDDEATGTLVSFVQQVGFSPVVVSVALAKDRPILDLVRRTGTFCLSVLSDSNSALLARFARGTQAGSIFENVATVMARSGVPMLAEAHAWLECRVLGEADWSDHVLVGAEVVDGMRQDDERPLVHIRKNGFSY